MAFQYVEGGDLDHFVGKNGPLTPLAALDILIACCDGLEAIHEAGLLHRDIKPHNIFLDHKGRPKVGDFGLARRAITDERLTVTGLGMGTPAYMAPEQAVGRADIDARVDIHALGGTFFHLLTGKAPFTGETAWMVANAVCNEPAPDPRRLCPGLPDAVAALVVTAMAKNPAERYPDAASLRQAAQYIRHTLAGGQSDSGTCSIAMPSLPGHASHLLVPIAWHVASAGLLLALPLILNPLLARNPAFIPMGYDQPGLWAIWIGSSLVGAALLSGPLALRHLPGPSRLRQALTALPGPLVATTLAALAGRSLDLLLGGTWPALPWLAGIATALGTFAYIGRSWWNRTPYLTGRRSILTSAQISAVCLLVIIAGHCWLAQTPRSHLVEESPAVLGGLLGSARTRTENSWDISIAWLLTAAAPLTATLILPLWLVRKKR
jgi:hypothetical protein